MPSAAPVGQARLCVSAWRGAGYKTAVLVEDSRLLGADWVLVTSDYRGYPASINQLAAVILENDPACHVVVAIGDDLMPDPHHTAAELEARFLAEHPDTLAVVQPTHDPWALDDGPPHATRVAGSPWMGRAWCLRAYGGRGPQWAEYYHMFADQELQIVATMLGVFYQWPDIDQRHEHWMRHGNSMPERMLKVDFNADKAIFERREAARFPGHELLPA